MNFVVLVAMITFLKLESSVLDGLCIKFPLRVDGMPVFLTPIQDSKEHLDQVRYL